MSERERERERARTSYSFCLCLGHIRDPVLGTLHGVSVQPLLPMHKYTASERSHHEIIEERRQKPREWSEITLSILQGWTSQRRGHTTSGQRTCLTEGARWVCEDT